MTKWISVTDLEPSQKLLVKVTGPSGMTTHKKFLTLAFIDDDWRPRGDGPPRWQTVTNDSLSDYSFFPTHWALLEEGELP